MACGDYASVIDALTGSGWANYMDFVTCGYIESMTGEVWGMFVLGSLMLAFMINSNSVVVPVVVAVLVGAGFGSLAFLPGPAASVLGLALLLVGAAILLRLLFQAKAIR